MRPEQGQHQKNPYYGKYYGHYYGNYYGNGQDGTEEAQEDLTPDAGSKTDGTAAETKNCCTGTEHRRKGECEVSTKGLTIGFLLQTQY